MLVLYGGREGDHPDPPPFQVEGVLGTPIEPIKSCARKAVFTIRFCQFGKRKSWKKSLKNTILRHFSLVYFISLRTGFTPEEGVDPVAPLMQRDLFGGGVLLV